MKREIILVPYDGSEGAKNAARYAVGLLDKTPEAKLVAFTSLAGTKDVAKLMGSGREGTGFVDDSTRGHYEKVRAKTYDKAIESMKADFSKMEIGVPVEFQADFAPSPVQGILDAAEEHGADAIVMGCRGVSAIAGMLGSVSFGVIRSAAVPVTVVK